MDEIQHSLSPDIWIYQLQIYQTLVDAEKRFHSSHDGGL